ncbi:hypothetical protein BH11GEM1_BH11GEM1_02080 [soil metagenome]
MPGAALFPAAAALLLCVFGVYPLANRLTGGTALEWFDHARLFWLVIGGAVLGMLLAFARLAPAAADALWRAGGRTVTRIPPRVFVGGVALFAFCVAAIFSVICFGRQPHNADEVAQLFHAKILLSGRLSLPPDPNPEFFGMDNMIEQGRWYSQFPVGGPAILALGVALRAAWLLNPALLALSILSLYGFTRRADDEGTARAAALLLALSPFALFVSASFMNHVPVLWLATVALWQLAIWVDAADSRGVNRAAALIGLSLGVAFTVRPLDALVVAAVVGGMQVSRLRGDLARLRSLAWQVAAGLAPVMVMFYVNLRTTGAPLRLGYEVLYGSAHQLGFHVDPYGTAHTPVRALMLASKYLLQLNVLLFEWPLPVVAIIAMGLFALRRPTRWDLFLIAFLFAQTIAYALYWHDGTFRGPRFLFTALPAIVILAARAPVAMAAVTRGTVRRAVLLLVPACVLVAWLAYGLGNSVPARVRTYRGASVASRVDADSMARSAGLQHAVVFINEGLQARNVHYLWALGLSRGYATRMMVSASPCAIRVSIDAEEARRPASAYGRLDRLVKGALAFDSAQPATMPPVCIEDLRLDIEGSASYAPFFAANTIDGDGHVGGNIVYALDLGAHNEVLRGRFGSRTWYRFGLRVAAHDSVPALTPYPATR